MFREIFYNTIAQTLRELNRVDRLKPKYLYSLSRLNVSYFFFGNKFRGIKKKVYFNSYFLGIY